MARIDERLQEALSQLPAKSTHKTQAEKKRYSEKVSQAVALALADELRHRGLKGAKPGSASEVGGSGAERRMSGGLGAKKVDVTWSTETDGLLLAISVKTINFKDDGTGNFQKNLTNRRSDMLMEAVTLHRRFPYAVLAGFFFLDKGAASDGTPRRRSTFENAHARLQLFTGRNDPAGREEQFERFYVLLLDASPANVELTCFAVGNSKESISLSDALDDLLTLTAQRNPDFYEFIDGKLQKAS
jgi:hypothetical protein